MKMPTLKINQIDQNKVKIISFSKAIKGVTPYSVVVGTPKEEKRPVFNCAKNDK